MKQRATSQEKETVHERKRIKIKGIFLDLDGTIVDSKEAYIEAAKIAFQAVGQRPPENEVALEIPRRLEQGLTINDITNGDYQKISKSVLSNMVFNQSRKNQTYT